MSFESPCRRGADKTDVTVMSHPFLHDEAGICFRNWLICIGNLPITCLLELIFLILRQIV